MINYELGINTANGRPGLKQEGNFRFSPTVFLGLLVNTGQSHHRQGFASL
jgi:hypothetical protein